jgi:lipopolysaccharide export system protein LptA
MSIRLATTILLILFGVTHAANALAEKADRAQELRISAKRGVVEGTKDANTKMVEGDVIIIQGTMRITADRAIVKENEGYVFAELFGSGNDQVTFRQKREGTDSFVEAWSDRAEFDNRASTLKLFSRAKFKSDGDQAVGEYFFYDTVNEKYELRNQVPNAKAAASQEDGRVNFVIQPRIKDSKPTPAAGKTN